MSIRHKIIERRPPNENISRALKLDFGICHFRKIFLNRNFHDFEKEFSLSGPRQEFCFPLLCKTELANHS